MWVWRSLTGQWLIAVSVPVNDGVSTLKSTPERGW